MTLVDTPAGSVDASTVATWRREDPSLRILDVRTPGEFELGHIPGAVNIPLAQLKHVCADVARNVSGPLVVTCQTGPRSREAEQLLQDHGCAKATLLNGGLNAWQAVGGDIETGRPLWSLERQVRLAAGSLVAAGVLTSLKFPAARFLSGAVGGGLVFAAVSNTCALGNVLGRLPYNQRSRQDVDDAVRALTAG